MGQMGAILGHILTLPHPHCQPGQIAPYIDSYIYITFLQWLKVIVLVTLKELGCIYSTKVSRNVQMKMSPKMGSKSQKGPIGIQNHSREAK